VHGNVLCNMVNTINFVYLLRHYSTSVGHLVLEDVTMVCLKDSNETNG